MGQAGRGVEICRAAIEWVSCDGERGFGGVILVLRMRLKCDEVCGRDGIGSVGFVQCGRAGTETGLLRKFTCGTPVPRLWFTGGRSGPCLLGWDGNGSVA